MPRGGQGNATRSADEKPAEVFYVDLLEEVQRDVNRILKRGFKGGEDGEGEEGTNTNGTNRSASNGTLGNATAENRGANSTEETLGGNATANATTENAVAEKPAILSENSTDNAGIAGNAENSTREANCSTETVTANATTENATTEPAVALSENSTANVESGAGNATAESANDCSFALVTKVAGPEIVPRPAEQPGFVIVGNRTVEIKYLDPLLAAALLNRSSEDASEETNATGNGSSGNASGSNYTSGAEEVVAPTAPELPLRPTEAVVKDIKTGEKNKKVERVGKKKSKADDAIKGRGKGAAGDGKKQSEGSEAKAIAADESGEDVVVAESSKTPESGGTTPDEGPPDASIVEVNSTDNSTSNATVNATNATNATNTTATTAAPVPPKPQLTRADDDLSSFRYHMHADLWWRYASLRSPWRERSFFGSAVYRGYLTLFGGVDASGNYLNDVWMTRDLQTWRRRVYDKIWSPRCSFAVAQIDSADGLSGSIFVVGGRSSRGVMNDVWMLDARSDRWLRITRHAGFSPRSDFAAAFVEKNLVVHGGRSAEDEMLSDLWVGRLVDGFSAAGEQEVRTWGGLGLKNVSSSAEETRTSSEAENIGIKREADADASRDGNAFAFYRKQAEAVLEYDVSSLVREVVYDSVYQPVLARYDANRELLGAFAPLEEASNATTGCSVLREGTNQEGTTSSVPQTPVSTIPLEHQQDLSVRRKRRPSIDWEFRGSTSFAKSGYAVTK